MTFRRYFPAFPRPSNAVGAAVFCVCVGFVTQSLTAQEAAATFYIREYRVEGAKKLKSLEVEEAVYPFLGPGRGAEDVEQARASLEKAYHEKGFETVSVVIPSQDPRRGVIRLQVVESSVGRLRVNGARYFLPSKIKKEAPSMAEGEVPDMNRVRKDILALNSRMPDRTVKPELRPGVAPGTVDIDLNVEDKRPLHGSLELNNQYSADTTPLRLNGALSYANMFQLGHTLGGSFQIAPENLDDAQVYSAYYLARLTQGFSLMAQGTKQNSDVSTLGGAASAGRGESVGLRGMWDLPAGETFYQTFSFGVDYKHYDDKLTIGKTVDPTPIEYYPLSANYGATWTGKHGFTELNHSLNFHLRGMGSSEPDYANKRYNADASYVYLRSDLSHVHDLKGGSQVFGKVQGQISSRPLVNSEQYAGGGLETARGYLEATALGDNGVFGTIEFRSPSFIGTADANGKRSSEWRVHAFADGGLVGIYDALPGQRSQYGFSSVGGGTRFMFLNHYNGSLDVAMPLIEQAHSDDGDVRVTFRGWADF